MYEGLEEAMNKAGSPFCPLMGLYRVLYRDNGKENGNYSILIGSILGLYRVSYRDTGKGGLGLRSPNQLRAPTSRSPRV